MTGICVIVITPHTACLQETGLYEYKIHGAMDDMDPEQCAQVYVDWEYRKKWDSYVLGECILTVLGGGVPAEICHYYISPLPFLSLFFSLPLSFSPSSSLSLRPSSHQR